MKNLEKIKKEVERIVGKKEYYIESDFDMIYFIEKDTEINFAVYNTKKGTLSIYQKKKNGGIDDEKSHIKDRHRGSVL